MSKIILVTGVSRGIGRAIVEKICATSDAVVLGIARSGAPLQELKTKYGEKFEYIVGDITDDAVIEKSLSLVTSKYGRLDAVIANAGVLDPVQDVNCIDVSEWKRLFDVNFFSVVTLVSNSLPLLKASQGNVIFVSSGASVTAYPSWGAYGSSKAALNHFAATIAADEPSVRAISVAPGVVDTQMQHDIRNKFSSSMVPSTLERFVNLDKNDQLLAPEVPATVYVNLALKGIPENVNGKYLRYDNNLIADYAT
ncbi:SDR family oxidoreductase Ecym_5639 [Eremothecium cymbalariae DBVPG|uniref:Ketoreductase domain-containing protein n=1 Tax=Eremothecium cymbalariae (strain CBS 270.75 / DBVPG 7215 / KCTC 17166 / NRRL Y-17582) TaxID=931890 RepID=I6NE83_ERECY|nr:hypothetical protein Ecym_5639 [Eremothecium cymbalariae DBVPG\